MALLLLALALLFLHGAHALRIVLTVQSGDVEFGEILLQKRLQQMQNLAIRAICAAVVVDEQFVVSGFGGDLREDLLIRVIHRNLALLRRPRAAVLASTKEKLARECNVDRYVAVHRMFAQEVDSELLPCLREAELPVEGEDIRKDPPTLAVLHKLQELFCEVETRRIELSVDC